VSHLVSHVTFDLIVTGVDTMLPFAENYAKLSVAKWDDSVVAFLKTIRASDVLMKWIHDLVCDHPEVIEKTGPERTGAIQAAMMATAPEGSMIRDILAQIGITWENALNFLPIVLRLLFTFIGKRG
jgi:hypothetical protein